MMAAYEQARNRAMTQSAALMRKRRHAARMARWRNSYTNLKKLVVKHLIALKFAGLCLVFGLLAGFCISVFNGAYKVTQVEAPVPGIYFPVLSIKSDEPVKPVQPQVLTPVAASGDETVLRLKLSTDLLLTNLSGKNQ